MENYNNEKLNKTTPCGKGGSCSLCKSRAWCKLAAGEVSGVKIENLDSSFPAEKGVDSEYHAVFDLGTTTIAGVLIKDSEIMANTGFLNPQIEYGADVLSRAQYSVQGGCAELQESIHGAIKKGVTELCDKAGILPASVKSGVITGNTTMLYLLTGRNPFCLTEAPFDADWTGDEETDIGGINFYLPPCISAFIGADVLCAVLASGMTRQPESSLLADMGTNGEIALWHSGRLTCCSAAAGPAFEGFGLSMGMAASEGAIEHVCSAGNRLIYNVIGGGEPKGICGSGIIDMIACMKHQGILQENGVLTEENPFINGSDIRLIQLAKSAVCAGIMTILEKKETDAGSIGKMWLAGGFGKNINMQNAANIGLFPFYLANKAQSLGNGALKGAVMMCSSETARDEARILAGKAETVQLAGDSVFEREFISGMAIKSVF